MKGYSKKALSIILMLALVFGAVPLQANAFDSDLEISGHGADPVTSLPSKLSNGEVWSDKSVIDNGDGTFKIRLRAAGQEFVRISQANEYVDVVLVLDISHSMTKRGEKPQKFTNMKTAAKSAVDIILGEGLDGTPGNRIALVKYNGMAQQVRTFSKDKGALKGDIDGLVASGGTNIQNAILTAATMIDNRTDKTNRPVIILLTDGEPTYYHQVYTGQTESNRKGNGSADNTSANHVMYTINQAVKAKNDISGLKIYTIGFGMSDLSSSGQTYAKATLQPTADNTKKYRKYTEPGGVRNYGSGSSTEPWDHKYWENESKFVGDDGADEIFNVFTQIATTITTSASPLDGNFVIEDVLGAGFIPVEPLPAGLSKTGNKVTWTINKSDFDNKLHSPDSTSIDPNKVHEIEFTVTCNATTAGTYYTNVKEDTEAQFKVKEDNPFYADESDKNITQNLPNRGWLTLIAKNINVTINVTKQVVGPTGWSDSTPRTFTYYFYYNDPSASAGSPIVSTPLSITVNGPGTKTEQQALTIPASQFTGGSIKIYVKENETAPDFWTYDSIKHVDISKSSPTGSVTFTNSYDPKGTLTVKKLWTENGPKSPVTFELQKEISEGNWEMVSSGHTLNAPDWEKTIGGLSLGVKYRVVENSIGDYVTSYSPAYLTFDADNLELTIEITNEYVTPKGKITVIKNWIDNENSAGDRPDQLVFNWTGPQDSSGQLVLKAADGWTNVLEREIFGQYTFTEVVPADYTVDAQSQTVTISLENRNAELEFANTYVVPKGKLTVTKNWVGDQGKEDYRPATITIEIFKDGEPAGDIILPKSVPEGENPWQHTFTDLEFGTYTAEESPALVDYDVTYSGDVVLSKANRTGGITVTNTFKNPKGWIDVSKAWVESGVDPGAVRPSSIIVTLLKNGVELGSITLPKAGNVWTHRFIDLPLDGSTYTVTESSSESAKLAQYDENIIYSGNGGIVLTKDNREGDATITNTYASGTITVIKSWEDDENPVGDRPTSVTVELFKRTVTEDEETGPSVAVVSMGRKTIPRPGNAVVFYDLEIAENVSYYVVEDSIPFYNTTYSVDPGDPSKYLVLDEEVPNGQITVTNTYTNPKGSLTVRKNWEHGNNPQAPSSVTVQLKANGEPSGTPVTFSGSHTFPNLDLGVTYTVEEVGGIPNYGITYSGDVEYTPAKGNDSVAGGEVTITNTYIPETGNLKIVKHWVGTAGGPISVIVKRSYDVEGTGVEDPGFSRTAELNSENNWTVVLTGLEIYGPGGNKYRYSAQEISGDLVLYAVVNEDTPTLNIDSEAVITITNTYTPAKGRLIIEKEWLNEEGGSLENPPDGNIEVRLIIDGVGEESTMILNKDNSWRVVREGLNVDKTYSVVEVTEFEEFDVSYSGAVTFNSQLLEATIKITNTRNPDEPDLSVEKEVADGSAVLVDGKATFHYTVILTNEGNRTLTNLVLQDTMTGPTGAVITYDPEPDSISGGVATFIIPGSLAPEESKTVHYSVTVDKAGDYLNVAEGSAWFGEEEITDSDEEGANVKAPGLSIIKSVVGPTVLTGNSGTFTYQLLIRNDGEVPLYDVTVTDQFAGNPDVTYEYTGSYAFDQATGTFTIGYLDNNGEDIIITYNVTFNKTGTYKNVALVSGWFDTGEYDEQENPIREELTDEDDATVTLKKKGGGGGGDDKPKDEPKDEPEVIPDEEIPEGTPDEPAILPEEDAPEVPKTGTDDHIGLLAILMAGSLAGAGLLVRRRRLKDE